MQNVHDDNCFQGYSGPRGLTMELTVTLWMGERGERKLKAVAWVG